VADGGSFEAEGQVSGKVAVIAPYPELREATERMVAELGADVQVVEGDLADGVRAAQRVVADGAEVVVSRGGTALLIKQSVDVPVVEIEVSPFDIIRSLDALKDQQGPIGVIGFRNLIYGCESVGKAFGVDLRELPITSREDVPAVIGAAARAGIRVILGGNTAVRQAASFGLKGVLVVSGREALLRSLHDALRIAEVRRVERERAELLRVLIGSSHEGIVVVDTQERITVLNRRAERLLGVAAGDVIGTPLQSKGPLARLRQVLRQGKEEHEDVLSIGDRAVISRYSPLLVNGRVDGAVAHLRDVTEIQRLEQIAREKLHAKGLYAKTRFEDLIGGSAAFLDLKRRAQKFAAADSTVLIMGESGTGKELLAQSIHNASARQAGPFVAVNCAALPESLLESELFGYVEGAFTGARRGGRAGLFELAHRGTVFLDEIGEMPLLLQNRLLRVLQERAILRIGGDRIVPTDVRVLASTNRNLTSHIEHGQFRGDLYYRLNTLTLIVPPLRDRREDVAVLATHFFTKHRHLNPAVGGIDQSALRLLDRYAWPGNVRELEHAIERLLILCEAPTVTVGEVRRILEGLTHDRHWGSPATIVSSSSELERLEIETIHRVLAEEGNNKSKAAERLGVSRSTLWRRLKSLRAASSVSNRNMCVG
jgi:PAS domain S-box-containing protein